MSIENPRNIFPLPDYTAPLPLNKESLASHMDSHGIMTSSVYREDHVNTILLVPEALRTPPVVNFLLYKFDTRGLGVREGRLPESLEELQAEIEKDFKVAHGSTLDMIISFLRYPESERSMTISRYQESDHERWMNSIEYGLVQGILVLDDDNDTITLHPQVEGLFFNAEYEVSKVVATAVRDLGNKTTGESIQKIFSLWSDGNVSIRIAINGVSDEIDPIERTFLEPERLEDYKIDWDDGTVEYRPKFAEDVHDW